MEDLATLLRSSVEITTHVSMVNLQLFYLHNNQLSGTLPDSWSSMNNLKNFYLHTNKWNIT